MAGFEKLPEGLPVPKDDGAADHIVGMEVPDLELQSTNGTWINLSDHSGTLVLYIYPMTGVPDVPLPNGWNEIPGARGCTPQSCAFRDHFQELKAAGADDVYGVSTQTTDYQKEAAERLHLPFPLLSDSELKLTHFLNLPTIRVQVPGQNCNLLKRMALIARQGRFDKCFYPVFPPEKNAEDVLAWLEENPG